MTLLWRGYFPFIFGEWMFSITILKSKCSKNLLLNPLERISDIWLFVDTKGVQIKPLSSSSFIKCLSTSTYLVLSCWTGFRSDTNSRLVITINFIVPSHGIFKSSRIIFIQDKCPRPLLKSLLLNLISQLHFSFYSSM